MSGRGPFRLFVTIACGLSALVAAGSTIPPMADGEAGTVVGLLILGAVFTVVALAAWRGGGEPKAPALPETDRPWR